MSGKRGKRIHREISVKLKISAKSRKHKKCEKCAEIEVMCECRGEIRHFYAEYVMKYAVCDILLDEGSHTTQNFAQKS
jgi:hypothetical protein